MTHILHYIFALVNYFFSFSCPVIFHSERANKLKNQVSIYITLTIVILLSLIPPFFVFLFLQKLLFLSFSSPVSDCLRYVTTHAYTHVHVYTLRYVYLDIDI